MTRTNLIHGIGVNDAEYVVKKIIKGKEISCPYYATWKTMIQRCYSSKLHDRCPTYIGCSVCDEWLFFMCFRRWMMQQDWESGQLDKDIINPGNKIYSPSNCCFVLQDINKLLTDSNAARGKYPQGVYLNVAAKKFQAYMKVSGVKKSLGYYFNPEDASKAYIEAKTTHILSIAKKQNDIRVRNGLIKHANILKAGFDNG